MSHFRPVLWQDAFIKAVDETDREALARLIHDAEQAMSLRRQQLDNQADYRREVRAMEIATRALDAVKVQKLSAEKKSATSNDRRPSEKFA
jgi:hypothetical protein